MSPSWPSDPKRLTLHFYPMASEVERWRRGWNRSVVPKPPLGTRPRRKNIILFWKITGLSPNYMRTDFQSVTNSFFLPRAGTTNKLDNKGGEKEKDEHRPVHSLEQHKFNTTAHWNRSPRSPTSFNTKQTRMNPSETLVVTCWIPQVTQVLTLKTKSCDPYAQTRLPPTHMLNPSSLSPVLRL